MTEEEKKKEKDWSGRILVVGLQLVRFPNPLLEWVGGTKPSRGVFFSSEARGTFNMHPNPILAYIFELSGMSAITFAVPNPLQVNSVQS